MLMLRASKIGEKANPYLPAASLGKSIVCERDADARFEGRVNATHTVGGQDHDAAAILEAADEN